MSDASSSVRVSVALVTRNRPKNLEACLASLRAQDVQPWEVLVSDDSDVEAAPASEEVARRWGCRYIRGPRRGLYANRNHAALACRGTHVRTMDDDHELPPGHLGRCLQAVSSDPESVWIVGEYTDPARVGRPPHPCPPQLHPRGYGVAPLDPQRCWAIADGSTIYPRAIFEAGPRMVDGFPFGYGYMEFGSLLHAIGYRIRHLGDTYVIHHSTSTSFDDSVVDDSSRLFAILCHSFIYQPTVRNVVLTTLTWMRLLAFRPTTTWPGVRRAIQAFQARRREVRALVRAETRGRRTPRAPVRPAETRPLV